MKTLLDFFIIIFLVTACGKTDKEKLTEELIPVIGEAQADKIEQAKRDFDRYQRNKLNQNINDEGFVAIQQAHFVATHFYSFTDSFVEQYRYEDFFPNEELTQHFTASFDSISAILPDLKLQSFDYTRSQHKEDLMLTVLRMNYDMALLETDVMNQLSENYWATIFRDDFRVR